MFECYWSCLSGICFRNFI
uniref:Uncharacterized protein n=1 Tax=Rhizophora mucronata TaxID=61149 RepID=A0A2P2QDX2_RHIMU